MKTPDEGTPSLSFDRKAQLDPSQVIDARVTDPVSRPLFSAGQRTAQAPAGMREYITHSGPQGDYQPSLSDAATFLHPADLAIAKQVQSDRLKMANYRAQVTPAQAAGVHTMAKLYGTVLPPGAIYSFGMAGVDPHAPEVHAAAKASVKKKRHKSLFGSAFDSVSGAVAKATDAAGWAADEGYGFAKAASRYTWAASMAAPQAFQASFRETMGGGHFMGGDIADQTDIGQLAQGKSSGSGFFVGGQAHRDQVQAAREAAPLIDGHAVTLGRYAASRSSGFLNSTVGAGMSPFLGKRVFDPGKVGYNLVSGLIDLVPAVGLDPTTYVPGGKIRAIKEARTTFAGSKGTHTLAELHEAMGIVHAPTRNTVIGDKAYDWLSKSTQGQRVVKWLADQNDILTIWNGTNRKIPASVARDLVDARTPAEVIDALAPHLNRSITHKFDLELAERDIRVVSAAAKVVRSPHSVRLFNMLPGSHLFLADTEDAITQMDRYLINAKVAREDRSALAYRLAGASSKQEQFDVIEDMMKSVGKSIVAHAKNSPPRVASKRALRYQAEREKAAGKLAKGLTTIWEDHRKTSAYWADELGNHLHANHLVVDGEVIDVQAHPHLWSEYLNSAVPLPNLREIRRATSSRTMQGLLNSRGGKATTLLLGAATHGIWVPLHLIRGAFVLRNMAEAQLRLASVGYANAFSHPMELMAWAIGQKGGLLERYTGRGAIDYEGREFGQRLSPAAAKADFFMRGLNHVGDQYQAARVGGKIQTRTTVVVGKRELEDYLDGWASQLSIIANDDLARRVIMQDLHKGDLTPGRDTLTGMDLVKDWAWNGTGKKFRRDIESDADFLSIVQREAGEPLTGKAAFDFYLDSIERRIQQFTGGSPELRELLRHGRLNKVSLWKGDRINSAIHRELEDYLDFGPENVVARDWVRAGKHDPDLMKVAGAWTQGVDWLFEHIASKPENYWNNSPVYRQAYWKAAEHLIEEMDQASATRLLANARAAKLNPEAIQRLEKAAARGGGDLDIEAANILAAQEGLSAVKKLLYTHHDRTQFFDVARNLFVFGDALRNVIRFWTKQLTHNPVLHHRGQQIVYGARSADANGDGQGFFYRDPETHEERYHIPGTDFLLTSAGVPGTGGMSGSVKGLNLATTSIIPGLAPGTSFLAAHLLPNREEFDGIRNLLLPYGEPDKGGPSSAILPAWAQKVWIGLGNGDRGAFASSTVDTMRYLVSTGDYDIMSKDPDTRVSELERLRADAQKDAKWLYIIRGIVQFVAPSAPKPDAEVKTKDGKLIRAFLLSQDYRNMLDDPNIGPTKANAEFIKKWGPLAMVVTEAKTEALTTTPANKEALDFQRKHPETVRRHKDVYGMFVSDKGDFSFDAYQHQIDTGERRRKTGSEVLDEYRQDLARYVVDRRKEQLGEAATTKAGRANLAELKASLRQVFGDPEPYDPEKQIKMVNHLTEALGDPVLANTEAGRALKMYLQAREHVAKAAAERGVTGWQTAKRTADLRERLNEYGLALLARYPQFSSMWDRVFERETVERGSG